LALLLTQEWKEPEHSPEIQNLKLDLPSAHKGKPFSSAKIILPLPRKMINSTNYIHKNQWTKLRGKKVLGEGNK
jgi:hypothetical protein